VVAGELLTLTGYSIFDPLMAGAIALWIIATTAREVFASHDDGEVIVADWYIAAQSQCGGMSAAGESGLCIAFTAWTLRAIISAAVARVTLRAAAGGAGRQDRRTYFARRMTLTPR
jgi:hypothetical protein